MRNPQPGDFYRDIVRELCINSNTQNSNLDSDTEFYHYLERCYNADKKALDDAGIKKGSPKSVSGITNGLFVFAVGLFTFGRLDVAEDIVHRAPKTGALRRLELVLDVLLPLPNNLEPMYDPAGFQRWLAKHRNNLRWNSKSGLYEQEADRAQ
jgi:hypothetical protein